MPSKDIVGGISHTQVLAPAATTGNRTGTVVDTLLYEGAAAIIYAGAWTDGTHTIDIQQSDDGTTGFSQLAATCIQGTKPVINGTTKQNQDYELGIVGSKRYVRVDIGVSAATIGAVIGASIILGHPKVGPI